MTRAAAMIDNYAISAALTTEPTSKATGGSRPLRVAVVDEHVPYPVMSGKSIRTVNLLLRLARRHRITLLCHRNHDTTETQRGISYLADHGIATVLVEGDPPPKSVMCSGPRFYARLGLNLLSPVPYLVQANCSRAIRLAVRRYSAAHPVDLWQCEWTPLAGVLRGLKQTPQLMIAHNIESLIWQRYYEAETNLLRRWYIKRQWRKFQRFEKQTFAAATHTVAVSEADAALARAEFAAERVAVVDNGVDTSYFRPRSDSREANHLLFLGSLDWRPNLDGISQFLQRVYPAVRAAEPAARLSIVGRNPPAWLADRVRSLPNVQIFANVPDVRPYLARAGIMIVPLRIGGGSRLKILEALAMETPVVSTRIGAEGLAVQADRHLVVTSDIDDMAPTLIAGMRAPGRMQDMARAGRQLVEDRYDWEQLASELERIWHQVTRIPSRERATTGRDNS
jgi:glycosyltransferase involved in cell wall biosynthesis